MKKNILLLFTIFYSHFLVAQTLVITGDNSVLTTDPCLTTNAYLVVKNNDNKEHEIICEKNVIGQSSGTSNYFCWGGNCYDSSTLVSTSTLTLAAGQSDGTSFGGYYDAFCDQGTATVEYCFYPVNDPNDRTCTMITYHGPATSLDKNFKNESIITDFFPNPTHNFVKFRCFANNTIFQIYDALGNQVREYNLFNGDDYKFYVGDLSNGIYICRFVSDNQIIGTKKIIIE